MATITEGWWWPANSRKAHYITKQRRSLCGKWGCLDPEAQFDRLPWSLDCCAECLRKWRKRSEHDS